MVRAYRPLLKEIDLTYPQYLIMMALWEEDGVMIKSLVERTRFDAGTLTPILKRLQDKKLVNLGKSSEDARQKYVHVTSAGRILVQKAESIPEALFCQADLSHEEALLLKKLTEKLYKSIS